jgi:hypothetical protein
MSDRNEITNEEVIRSLKVAQAHVTHIQTAISEGGSGVVYPNDWQSLQHLVKKYKDPKNSHWTKQAPNAPFIQAIVRAYDSLANKPPRQDFEADTNAINTILANIQKQINNYDAHTETSQRDKSLNHIEIHHKRPKEPESSAHLNRSDKAAIIEVLQTGLESVYNIHDAISEGGEVPVAQSDMEALILIVESLKAAPWSHKSLYKHEIQSIESDFKHLKLDKNSLPESDNIENSKRLDYIAKNMQKIISNINSNKDQAA